MGGKGDIIFILDVHISKQLLNMVDILLNSLLVIALTIKSKRLEFHEFHQVCTSSSLLCHEGIITSYRNSKPDQGKSHFSGRNHWIRHYDAH